MSITRALLRSADSMLTNHLAGIPTPVIWMPLILVLGAWAELRSS